MKGRRPIAPLLLGPLLLAMAAGQLADVAAFADILRTYDLLTGGELVAAVLVPAAEAAAGAGLLASRALPARLARGAGALGLGVAVFWSLLAGQAFARGLELENCGCFGVYLAQSLRWWVLLQDAYFLLLAWVAALGAGVRLPRLRLQPLGSYGSRSTSARPSGKS